MRNGVSQAPYASFREMSGQTERERHLGRILPSVGGRLNGERSRRNVGCGTVAPQHGPAHSGRGLFAVPAVTQMIGLWNNLSTEPPGPLTPSRRRCRERVLSTATGGSLDGRADQWAQVAGLLAVEVGNTYGISATTTRPPPTDPASYRWLLSELRVAPLALRGVEAPSQRSSSYRPTTNFPAWGATPRRSG
jgi:hypothetical protein